MVPLATRIAIASLASFMLTMLLGATVISVMQQMGSGVDLNVILWIFFPTTFFLSSTVLEYLELGSLTSSLRASLLSTALAAAVAIILCVIWYGTSVFQIFSSR